MEIAFEVCKWLSLALPITALILFVLHLVVRACSERDGIALLGATFICLVLTIPVLFAAHMLKTSLLPQCPTCNKAVSTEYCPDCGWEANLTSPTITTHHCTHCNHPFGEADNFCPTCGTSVAEPSVICSHCGKELSVEDKFCSACGTKISQE